MNPILVLGLILAGVVVILLVLFVILTLLGRAEERADRAERMLARRYPCRSVVEETEVQ